MPGIPLGLTGTTSTSKLKLPKAAPLQQPEKTADAATLTLVGRSVQVTSQLASKLYNAPRLVLHAGVIAMVGAIVLTGSTGHPAKLNPLADRTGYGSVLDQAAATQVAAKVADQTNLIVTNELDTSSKKLNSQVSLATSDDTTLAKRQVVDTAGGSGRGTVTYAVQPNDTIASIATQYNITTDTIRWANNLGASDEIKPGQSLVILPISGVRYQVQSGDSAESIASHFQSNADQIVAFNNAELSGIQAGQTIVVPDGVMPAEAGRGAAATASANNAPASAAVASGKAQAAGGPNTYAYGYCTWYVASRRSVPSFWGNANAWYSNAQISGYSVGSVPRPGAIAWTGAGYYGHVAYVESVSGGNVTVSEMNWNGGWGRVSSRTVPASSFRYIY